MTNETLAGYANLSLYSAMAVLRRRDAAATPRTSPACCPPATARRRPGERTPRRVPSVPVAATAVLADARPPRSTWSPPRARAAAGIGRHHHLAGGLLLAASVPCGGCRSTGAPLGNMFEFARRRRRFHGWRTTSWCDPPRPALARAVHHHCPSCCCSAWPCAVWYTGRPSCVPSLQELLADHPRDRRRARQRPSSPSPPRATGVYLVKDRFEAVAADAASSTGSPRPGRSSGPRTACTSSPSRCGRSR